MATTTTLTTPMELLGSHPGISVIDPSTVLTRLWYFDGKFLRAEGFRLDQEYVRSLVTLSNQAVGTGVVHGFDVRLGASDAFTVQGGLGLAPSGRVVYLPRDVGVSIAKLIDRSEGRFDPAEAAAPGAPDFSPCPPEGPDAPDIPLPPRPLYVLTVAAAEALCGEEERFGKLCEDACAADTERSVAVEGVRFRVRELSLTLPVSKGVPFTGQHLRSRVASAYYRAERDAVATMISGAGLRSPVWCSGAEGIGGEEIPLAVFDRRGAVTTFADMWIARRELVEPTPGRYWQSRFAMRPLDVFLAQVLQFQCQLVGIGSGGDLPGDTDPCADERRVLHEVGEVLGVVTGAQPAVAGVVALAAPAATMPPAIADRLGELRMLVAATLSGIQPSASGSVLIDRGIVETPPAGYLPVDQSGDVGAQVRALLGAGVDLRFCAVRPDFVPEAVHEAQHMERISLTRGLDDPGALEEVDVLVPGGIVARTGTEVGAFEGVVRVLAGTGVTGGIATDASALALSAVARDQVTDGWAWSLAAFGELPPRLGVANLATAAFRVAGRPVSSDDGSTIRIPLTADDLQALRATDLRLRINREAAEARIRAERVAEAVAAGRDEFVADAPVQPVVRRPVAGWFDVEVADALDALPIGQQTPVRLRATAYSRAAGEPLLADARIVGTATVTARQTVPGSGASGSEMVVTTRVDGTLDPLVIVGGQLSDAAPRPIAGLELHWRIAAQPSGTRILEVRQAVSDRAALARFRESGRPRHIEGAFGSVHTDEAAEEAEEADEDVIVTGFQPVTERVAGGRQFRHVLDTALDERATALDPGTPGRDIGNAAIDVIAAELAARGRENGFAELARRRLFDGIGASDTTITAAADWVMFHRRRTKRCGDAEVERPVAVRRLQWYHAAISAAGDVLGLGTMLRGSVRAVESEGERAFARLRARLDDIGWEPVTVVEFEEGAIGVHSSVAALRTAWSSGQRGDRMLAAAIATEGIGEGGAINLARLQSAMAAVGDLISIDDAQTHVLTEIPPEFQSPGLDGVILTVGATRRDVVTACAHVFRVSSEGFDALTNLLPDLGNLDEIGQVMERFGAPEPFVARYEDDTLTNADEVQAWWSTAGAGAAVRGALMVLDRSLAGDSAAVERWVDQRAAALGEVLEFGRPDLFEDAMPDLQPCRAAVFLHEVRRG